MKYKMLVTGNNDKNNWNTHGCTLALVCAYYKYNEKLTAHYGQGLTNIVYWKETLS